MNPHVQHHAHFALLRICWLKIYHTLLYNSKYKCQCRTHYTLYSFNPWKGTRGVESRSKETIFCHESLEPQCIEYIRILLLIVCVRFIKWGREIAWEHISLINLCRITLGNKSWFMDRQFSVHGSDLICLTLSFLLWYQELCGYYWWISSIKTKMGNLAVEFYKYRNVFLMIINMLGIL